MKKFSTAICIIMICAALCFFFLVGLNMPGEWWPYAVGAALLIIGAAFAAVSDVLNKGSEKRAEERAKRDGEIKNMRAELSENLAKEKAARDERLRNIHTNAGR